MNKSVMETDYGNLYLYVGKYLNNNRLYIGIQDINENLIYDVTINLPECDIETDEYIYLNPDVDDEVKQVLQSKKIMVQS